jgi:hypothetical protein
MRRVGINPFAVKEKGSASMVQTWQASQRSYRRATKLFDMLLLLVIKSHGEVSTKQLSFHVNADRRHLVLG